MKVQADIDIDFANRDQALAGIRHISASLLRNSRLEKHNTGVYFHQVPQDPISQLCSLPYAEAEQMGWFKVDLLNVHVYEKVKSPDHLQELINRELDWKLFEYPEFVQQLIHLHNHAELVATLKPQSILDLARILAVIRPGKQHLISVAKAKNLDAIEQDIWQQTDTGYSFKKSHALGYALLVKVHAEIMIDELAQP